MADPQDSRRLMEPGFYVVRMPHRGAGSRLIIESVCFRQKPGVSEGFARASADNWCGFIQSLHPKDDVFVIERKEDASSTHSG